MISEDLIKLFIAVEVVNFAMNIVVVAMNTEIRKELQSLKETLHKTNIRITKNNNLLRQYNDEEDQSEEE